MDCSEIVKCLFLNILDMMIYISTHRALEGRVVFADPRIFDVLVMQFGSLQNADYLYCLVREDLRHSLLDNNLCPANHTTAGFLLRNASTESHHHIPESR